MAATTLPEPGRMPAAPQLRLQHQVILALDLGQTTGWAVRARDGVITHGTVQFRPGRHEGGGMPPRSALLHRALAQGGQR